MRARSSAPGVVIGLSGPDDAGVFALDDEHVLVQTVDFFTPIVDDARDWGAIAAANALSDVYAMGARPLTALALLAFPVASMLPAIAADVLEGGHDVMDEAGCAVIGGHTIDQDAPTFGFAVTGLGHADRLLTKAAVRPGDTLFLSKPVGSGVITTAARDDACPAGVLEGAVTSMRRLNAVGMDLWNAGVRAATDVTGFGLLGHALEMTKASGLRFEIRASQVPVLDGAHTLAENDHFPSGMRRNRAHGEGQVTFDEAVPLFLRNLLFDPVTSGGLLLAVSREALSTVTGLLSSEGLVTRPIGRAVAGSAGTVEVLA